MTDSLRHLVMSALYSKSRFVEYLEQIHEVSSWLYVQWTSLGNNDNLIPLFVLFVIFHDLNRGIKFWSIN